MESEKNAIKTMIVENNNIAMSISYKHYHNGVISAMTHAQNFYLLKIYLNLFEISNRVLKFENLIEIIIPSKNLFQTWTTGSGAMCVCSSL